MGLKYNAIVFQLTVTTSSLGDGCVFCCFHSKKNHSFSNNLLEYRKKLSSGDDSPHKTGRARASDHPSGVGARSVKGCP